MSPQDRIVGALGALGPSTRRRLYRHLHVERWPDPAAFDQALDALAQVRDVLPLVRLRRRGGAPVCQYRLPGS